MNRILFLAKQILRDLLNRKKFSAFFILNLSIGLLGLTLISTFDGSLRRFLDDNLRFQLNADLVVRAREPFSEAAINTLTEISQKYGAETSKELRLNSMASANVDGTTKSKVIQLQVVDENFPLLGSLFLSQQIFNQSNNNILNDSSSLNKAIIDDDLALLFDLKIGDSFKIGDANLIVADILKRNALDFSSAFFERVYINFDTAANTGLIGKTSRITYRYNLKLNNLSDIKLLSAELKTGFKALKAVEKGPSNTQMAERIRVRTYHDSNNNILNLSSLVLSYLTLVAIMVFVLSALGSMYLYRHYVQKKYRDIAVFKILGMPKKDISIIFAGQMFTMASLGLGVNFLVSYVAVKIGNIFLKDAFYPEFFLQLDGLTFFKIALIAYIGFPIFCLPSLLTLKNLKLSGLFSEFGDFKAFSDFKLNQGWRRFLGYLPLLFFFLGSTLLISFKLQSLLFYLTLVAVVFFFTAVGWGWLKLLDGVLNWLNNSKKLKPQYLVLKHCLLLVLRYRFASLQCFVALSVASFLIFLIPQLYSGISDELSPAAGKSPDFFLFDIQPDQVGDLKKLANSYGVTLDNISPMLRARLIEVNNMPLAQWQEKAGINIDFGDRGSDEDDNDSNDDERAARSNSVNFNISYKAGLNAAEKIIKGADSFGQFDPKSATLPKISLERQFAAQNGFKIGDQLGFEIYGDKVIGQVTNIRDVRWNYFFPNFFIIFQPGLLEDYPHIKLANLTGVNAKIQKEFSNQLFDQFSNITMFDVRATVATILNLAKNIVLIALLICILALIAGLISLYGIMLAESQRQKLGYNLFKVMGLPRQFIGWLAFLQYGILSTFGAFFSMFFAAVIYIAVGRFVFNLFWIPSFLNLGLIFVTISLLTTLWMLMSTYKVILSSPSKIFS